jgi:hypothetical protein
MAEFDLFANQLLEEAKRFLEKARESSETKAEAANLHAALTLSFCALEAHVNAVADELSGTPELSVHERGLLLEKDVKLEHGEFRIQANLRISRLEDKFELLHLRFSGKPVDYSLSWWSKLKAAIELRNRLTHAKTIPTITEMSVQQAMESIIDALEALYQAVYKKKFPLSYQGLHSSLEF